MAFGVHDRVPVVSVAFGVHDRVPVVSVAFGVHDRVPVVSVMRAARTGLIDISLVLGT